MPVDLHTHSLHSDGTDTPTRIVEAAAAAGLTAVALTDHDTLGGIAEASAAAAGAGIRLVPGVELSVDWPTGTMHMLAYFLAPVQGPLQDRLGALRRGREERNVRIVDRLAALGLHVSYDEVRAEAGRHGVVGRPHIAAVLVAKGHVPDISAAFDRYLAKGRPAYEPRMRLGAVEAVRLARASGAVPVVAHPHTIAVAAGDYRAAFVELAAAGLGGIEAHYAEYPVETRLHLADLAASLGLAATGGSDYHGEYKPGLRVGSGRGDLVVPDSALDDLISARSDPSSSERTGR
jgi:predicted metal-dependent phosphoesterase TrpH